MSNFLKGFFAPDKEQELLQSFVRVDVDSDDEFDDETRNLSKSNTHGHGRAAYQTKQQRQRGKSVKFSESFADGKMDKIERDLRASRNKIEAETVRKRKPRENFNDFYTDKDRAAAVSAGAYDIKQSLQIKNKQDRNNETLQIPEESDISSIIALGLKEIKNANPENAIIFFTKALELNGTDINALVSRSKCYLLLGEASKALCDAETALNEDKNNIRAIYQKAESLYYLGQFEQSLMFFHCGLRARPELASFRLGVQKTQEAIENTIGTSTKVAKSQLSIPRIKPKHKSGDSTPKSQLNSSRPLPRPKATKAELERRNARKLLGELCIDKEYLENLLKHPDLKRADTNTENVSSYAREAVEFLNKRQEFWRQQRPCTALPNHKNLPADAIPRWF